MYRELIIFGVDNYNALGILRSLGQWGHKTTLIVQDTRCNIAYLSKYVKDYHRIQTLDEGYQILLKYANEKTKPFIFTNDDKAQAYLDEHYSELKDKFNFFNCNGNDIKKYMNKYNILQIAKKHGFNVLDTQVLNTKVPDIDLDLLEYPLVTKTISPLAGKWKGDFHICESSDELNSVLKEMEVPNILIQEFVDKKNEYCIDGFSINHGQDVLFCFATTYNYNIKGYYSPYMTVHDVDINLLEKLKSLLKDLQFEGIFSIEFLIDKDDNYYFSEINFRNSTWSYIGSHPDIQRNIPYNWILSTENKITTIIDNTIPKDFTAMVEPIDYQKRVIERKYPRCLWIKDWLNTNCKFYRSLTDFKPYLHMIKNNKKLR